MLRQDTEVRLLASIPEYGLVEGTIGYIEGWVGDGLNGSNYVDYFEVDFYGEDDGVIDKPYLTVTIASDLLEEVE